MSMREYPILFDDTPLLRPTKWTESKDVLENVMTTEAGTDYIELIRYKLSISAGFGVTGAWAAVFQNFSEQDTIEVKIYDVVEEDYVQRTMRMRNYKAKLKKDSELLEAVNGVWEISFNLEEI